jgi:hypothetical protein
VKKAGAGGAQRRLPLHRLHPRVHTLPLTLPGPSHQPWSIPANRAFNEEFYAKAAKWLEDPNNKTYKWAGASGGRAGRRTPWRACTGQQQARGSSRPAAQP